MKKFIDDLEIISDGIIHITDDKELKINITNDLILRFTFCSDDNDKSHRVDYNLNNDKDLSIRCLNFDAQIGEGVLSPIKLGTLGGKDMYVSIFVWNIDINKGLRVFSYNLYQRKN